MFAWLLRKKKSKFSDDYLFSPIDKNIIEDPYPAYDYLRQHQAVHRSETGAYILTRYDDVVMALSDERFSNAPAIHAVVNQRNSQRYLCAEVANNILPFIEGNRHHTERRQIGSSFFAAIKQFQGAEGKSLVEECARHVLDPLLERNEFDVIHDFGTPFSGSIMCKLMDIPVDDLHRLSILSEAFLYLFTPINSEEIRLQLDESLRELRDYFSKVIEQRLNSSEDDWISCLIRDNKHATEPLSKEALADTLGLFFADGLENVDRVLGTLFKLLVEQGIQQDELLAEPKVLEHFVDECLRFESPVQFISRTATTDMMMHGVSIKAGASIYLMLGAANRDPEVIENPNSFSLSREKHTPLSFGRGGHTCMGRHLVRAQLCAALEVILRSCPDLRLVNTSFEWELRPGHRWLSACRVRF